MKTYLDCLPCFCRQALEAVRFVTDDESVQEQVLRRVLEESSRMDLQMTPPEMGRFIHRLIRDLTGNTDPYQEIKTQFNRSALELYRQLEEKVRVASNPLEAAVRLAIAGNIIDFAAMPGLKNSQVQNAVDEALRTPLVGDGLEVFEQAIEESRQILYLGDNAGEIVFDRLLVEQLPLEKLTYVVKAEPIINDATMEDARATRLTEIVEVIDNGGDAPGTILGECSEDFQRRFETADMIIAKGQGNFETLSDAPGNIFFLLMAKCPMIAKEIGCEVGNLVLKAGGSRRAVVNEVEISVA